jgi:hypothetical protein
MTRIRQGDSRHRNRNAQYLLGPSSKDFQALSETPCCRPEQRTEWNVRDSDAILIILDPKGLSVSKGTRCAQECADRYGKPLLVIDVSRPDAAAQVAEWLDVQRRRFGEQLTLGIGGPRESEAPGIYASARPILAKSLPTG